MSKYLKSKKKKNCIVLKIQVNVEIVIFNLEEELSSYWSHGQFFYTRHVALCPSKTITSIVFLMIDIVVAYSSTCYGNKTIFQLSQTAAFPSTGFQHWPFHHVFVCRTTAAKRIFSSNPNWQSFICNCKCNNYVCKVAKYSKIIR